MLYEVITLSIEPKVSDEVKGRRLLELQALQEQLSDEAYAGLVGTNTEVIFEGASRKEGPEGEPSLAARDAHGRVVNVLLEPGAKLPEDLTGTAARVTITRAKKHSLIAKLPEAAWSK